MRAALLGDRHTDRPVTVHGRTPAVSKYLVTGATGFLGGHLVSALHARGHEVVPFSRSNGGDVLDAASVRAAAAGCAGAFHCAGKVSRDEADAGELYRVHVEGTKTALAACKAAGVRRVVVASSSGTVAISDDPDHVATEDDETPIGIIARFPYYRAKLFAERAAVAASEPGFDVLVVNPSLLLGPGDLRGSSTEDIRLLLERRVPAVPPGGASFVDARDAAEGMILAMERGAAGRRYLLTACNLTVRELFARVARIGNVPAPTIPMPRAPELARAGASLLGRLARRVGAELPVDPVSLEMAHYFWYASSARAEHELGWTQRDANETLSDTVRDLRERGVVWPEPDARAG
jgi:dihydroflavonol-4-reductase